MLLSYDLIIEWVINVVDMCLNFGCLFWVLDYKLNRLQSCIIPRVMILGEVLSDFLKNIKMFSLKTW